MTAADPESRISRWSFRDKDNAFKPELNSGTLISLALRFFRLRGYKYRFQMRRRSPRPSSLYLSSVGETKTLSMGRPVSCLGFTPTYHALLRGPIFHIQNLSVQWLPACGGPTNILAPGATWSSAWSELKLTASTGWLRWCRDHCLASLLLAPTFREIRLACHQGGEDVAGAHILRIWKSTQRSPTLSDTRRGNALRAPLSAMSNSFPNVPYGA